MIDSIHQSQLNTWMRCGEQFRRRYIEGEIIPPGIAARRGSSVHKAADINHKQKITSKIDMPIDNLKDATRDSYVKLIKDEGVFIPKENISEKNSLLNKGLNQAIDAIEIYHNDIAPKIQPIVSEKFIITDIQAGLPIAGTLDLLDIENNIIDLKVMKRKNQAWADREIQPTIYHLLAKEETGKWPKKFKYEIMIPNKTVISDCLETIRTDRDVEILKQYINAFLKDLKAGIFRPADVGHWICDPNWCGFYHSCKFTRR